MKNFVIATGMLISFGLVASPAVALGAEDDKAVSLDDLLQKVKTGWRIDAEEHKKREREFMRAKSKQEALLKKAQAALTAEQRRSETMEKEFNENEINIIKLQETLKIRLGTMGELFGVIRQIAGDTRGFLDASLISSQYSDRSKSLEKLAKSKDLPSVEELEGLWFALMKEMTETGKVVRYNASVVMPDGTKAQKRIVRVGSFNAVSEGKYIVWAADEGNLKQLARQPGKRHLGTVDNLEDAKTGSYVRFSLDPSSGTLLSMLVQTPSFFEQLEFGGTVGYIIIGLGILSVIFALLRAITLNWTGLKVRRQQGRPNRPSKGNPLGRILTVYSENKGLDNETLELKLDEAIIKESSRLDRFLWAFKTVSVVAPLLGLLGTITGMIRTFQSITLYGTGDPRMMAGGISEALVTTMLGLIVAIPLVLLHSWLASIARRVAYVLREESAGIVATIAEQEKQGEAIN